MTSMIYEDWMKYTEADPADIYGKIIPKKGAPNWVYDKIKEYYKEINSRYPRGGDY